EYSVKVLQEKPELAILGTWSAEVEDIETNSRFYFIREVPTSFKGIKRHGRFRTPFNHVTTFFLKEAALAAGGYRNYYYYEDWDLWLRMFQLGYKGENIPKVLVLVQQNYSRRSGWKSIQGDFKALTGFYKAGHHSFWMLLLNL